MVSVETDSHVAKTYRVEYAVISPGGIKDLEQCVWLGHKKNKQDSSIDNKIYLQP